MTQIHMLAQLVWQFTRSVRRAATESNLSVDKTRPASLRLDAERWSAPFPVAGWRHQRGSWLNTGPCAGEQPKTCFHPGAEVCIRLRSMLNWFSPFTPVYKRSPTADVQIPDQPMRSKSTGAPKSSPLWGGGTAHRTTPHPSCNQAAFICRFSAMKMVRRALKVEAELRCVFSINPTVSAWRISDGCFINDKAIRQKTDVQIQLSGDIRQLKHISLSSLYAFTKCAANSCSPGLWINLPLPPVHHAYTRAR